MRSPADTSILIVDDEPANLRLLFALLDEHGYVVRFATGGRTALASVRAEAPDLVLLDIDMPDLSGYDVCRQLKDDPATRDIPVLFVSAAQDADAKVRSFQVGGVDYVSKPFQVDEVLARIRHQLTIHRQRRQIEAQAARLRELDDAKSRFFAGVSHEFRTPLMLTRGLVQDVLDGVRGPVPAPARAELERALLHADRLEELIAQILDLSKLEVGAVRLERRMVDLTALARRLVDAFAPLAERTGVALRVDAPAAPVVLPADAEALVKVVTNLLSNACRHTPRGGRVTLRLAGDDDAVRLSVEDTGCGIPADVLPRVFERFYHHDDGAARPGTGIGLALARELVELHGGTLGVESTVGRGSTFTARLPRVAAAGDGAPTTDAPLIRLRGVEAELLAAEPAPERPADTDDDDDHTTVLVVDDNAEVRRYVRSHLAARYRVLEAADGRQALQTARRVLPDLVVSDVQMPGLDGLALCRALKQDRQTSFIPVVLLTVRAEGEARLGGLAAGADAYLGKPFSVSELLARVDNLIAAQRRLRAHHAAAPEADAAGALAVQATDLDADEIDFLHRLTETVEARLADPDFTVADLAAALAQDRTTLYRWIQRLLGQSPSDVLRTLRLRRGAALLRERAGTVSEVAYAVGFRSVQHFDRCFRAAYDTTPTDYMEQHHAAS